MAREKPTALGTYIFQGGFTLGVKKHFKVLAHFEENPPYAGKTFQKNHPEIPLYAGVEDWPRKQYRGVNFVFANCPCAPWSSLGKHRWEEDGRVQCSHNAFALLRDLKPNVLAMESVTQIFTRGRPLIREFTEKALAQGYSVTYLLVDSKYLGMAQSRKRFFFIAHNLAIPWEAVDFDRPILTVGEALRGVKPVYEADELKKGIYAKLLSYTKPGESLIDGFNRRQAKLKLKNELNHLGHVVGRPGFSSYRLREDRPCGAVTGGGMIHWKDDRFLAFNECVRLNGYPDDYSWECTTSQRNGELARGVCPPVGEWLAKNIAKAVRGGAGTKHEITLKDIRKPGIPDLISTKLDRVLSSEIQEHVPMIQVPGEGRRYVKITSPAEARKEGQRQLASVMPRTRPTSPRPATGPGPTRAPKANDSARIKVLVKDNPRRSPTARAIFDLYRGSKTLGDFKAKAKLVHPSFSSYHREDLEHGYIELVGG